MTISEIKLVLDASHEYVEWIIEQGFDTDDFSHDDQLAFINEATRPAEIQLLNDLLNLCEDNEIMRQAINQYFASRK